MIALILMGVGCVIVGVAWALVTVCSGDERTTMPDVPHCCFLDQDSQAGCVQPAEFEIIPIAARTNPDDFTHACVTHVGPLLGSVDGLAEQWSVYQLTPPVPR